MNPRRAARPALIRGIPLDRHAVIEASAGTGKTFTLEHLIVELVLAGDVTLDQVLVVTFTEKATHELRVRVRGKLEELLRDQAPEPDAAAIARGDYWTLDENARRKLERALHAFDGATIATIHAFCQRLLRDNAFASGRLFEENQVDGRDAFGRALREALRRDVAADPNRAPWLEAALRTGWSMGALETLLWNCTLARGELRPAFDPAELQTALDAFPFDDAVLLDGIDTMKRWGLPTQTARAVAKRLYTLATAVDRAREAHGAVSFVEDPGEDCFEYLLEKAPRNGQPGPTLRACVAALRLAEVTPTLPAALANIVLPPVRAELARRKRQAGQYDFDDMLSLVQDGLAGPRAGALVRSMRERYRFVLIDEFQDTDEMQWDIFRRAFFEASKDAGVPRSVLHLVGDPKQSIYRFRGADVQTYLEARDQVARSGGELLHLDRNFRATARLVEATNALFDPAAPTPVFSGENCYAPVACGRPERILVDGSGREVSPIHAFRIEPEMHGGTLGTRVAREITRLLDPMAPWKLDGKDLEPQDVFILTRTKAEGRAMGFALRAAAVPYAFYKEEGLFQTDEAREIRTLLSAIVDPDDRACRLAAWMTRFFALPLEDLERARALPATHPYVARLETWKALADARDFAQLFQSIVRDSGILRREIFFADGERELTNTLHILELLLEQARRTPCTLRDLVLLLGGLSDASRLPLDLEGNVQRLESERRAVQIMTIHKSKGLEAAVVFLAGGWSGGGGGREEVRVLHEDGRRIAWVGKLRPDVKPVVVAEEREEDQRLMYVALTRAKGRLYLPLILKDGAPRSRGAYEPINRRLAQLVDGESPHVTVDAPSPAVRLRSIPANDAGVTAWRPPEALLAPDDSRLEIGKLRERHAGDTVTSYTRMRASRAGARSAFVDEAVDRRAEKARDEIDAAGPDRLRSARASGVFVHEVLERVPLVSLAAADLDAWRQRSDVGSLFEEAMKIHRVDPRQRAHAEELVWAALRTPVTLPGDGAPRLDGFARADRIAREMEFVYPVKGTRTFVRGSLDLAFEHAGLTYFVDWKTDSLASFAPADLREHVQLHYGDQVTLYALATVRLLGVTSRAEYDARFGGLLYCFLRGLDAAGAGVWSVRPSWDDVSGWEQDLRRRMEKRR